jgi:hypothetical protein
MPTLNWHFTTIGYKLINRARQPNPYGQKCTYAVHGTSYHYAEIDFNGAMAIGVEAVNYEAALSVFRDVFGARTIDQFLDSEEVTYHEIEVKDADDTEIILFINTENRTAGFVMCGLKPSIAAVDQFYSATAWETEAAIRSLLELPRIAREHETPL